MLLVGLAGIMASSMALAGEAAEPKVVPDVQAEPQYRLAVIYSPHKTELHAPNYLQSQGFLPKDHSSSGANYYGFMGEVNFGDINLSLDYLAGTADSYPGATDTTNNNSFNPLSDQQTETLTHLIGYNVLNSPIFGRWDATVGYCRIWEQKAVTPANWYDGLEFGVKGRRTWKGGFALVYKLGYVPFASLHGFMKDYNHMSGDNILNAKFGVEIPVVNGAYGSLSAIGGYLWSRTENRALFDGSGAIATFSGFYLGGMYSF